VTRVLLFATQATPDGTPTALLPINGVPAVERLADQLRLVESVNITVITRPGWADRLRVGGLSAVESEDVANDLAVIGAAVAGTDGAVVLAAADLVAHTGALTSFAGPRATRTSAAVQAAKNVRFGAYGEPVMRERNMVVSVGTHQRVVTRPNAMFRALLRVSAADRQRLYDTCSALRTEAIDSGRDLDADAGEYGAVGLMLLGLVRTGVDVAAVNPRVYVCHRIDSVDAAGATEVALARVDEDAAALRMGVKEDDEFFATYLVHSYTPRLVKFFARRGITPTQVTWMSVGVGVLAALLFAIGVRWLWIPGAVVLYASFILDCSDGSLARYTGNFSRYGGWLDMIADRGKEYLVFAGAAIGGVRLHEPAVWGLAITAMVVQTVRHMVDTWYGALQDTATRALPVVPLGSPRDALGLRAAGGGGAAEAGGEGTATSEGHSGAAAVGAKLGQLSATAHGHYRSPAYWFKRSVVMPIGDRWLLMAIAISIGGPRVMFIALLIAIGLAFAYVLAGRTLRALAMRVVVMPHYNIGYQRDDGFIARLIGRASAGAAMSPLVAVLPGLVCTLVTLGFAIGGDVAARWVVLPLGVLALFGATAADSPHDGPLDWLTAAGLRAVEYVFIVTAGILGGVPLWLVFSLLFVLVMYHYDLVARIEKPETPVAGIGLLRGWDIRVVIIAVTTALGWAEVAYAVGTVVIGGVFLTAALNGWRRTSRADQAAAARGTPATASK
jgi:hypothetical protein